MACPGARHAETGSRADSRARGRETSAERLLSAVAVYWWPERADPGPPLAKSAGGISGLQDACLPHHLELVYRSWRSAQYLHHLVSEPLGHGLEG